MRVWVSRAAPQAEATARRLRERGHEPVLGPILEVRPLPAAVDLAGVGALAFTSINGVRAFRALPEADAALGLPVFAVGDATAAAARKAGFGAVRSAAGDGRALLRLILEEGAMQGAVLHPGPLQPAVDLAGSLARAGRAARYAAVYETVPAVLRAEAAAELRAGRIDAVMVHSPKGGQTVAAILQAAPPPRPIRALCVSEAAAAPLRAGNLALIAVADYADEAALLKLADEANRPDRVQNP